MQETTTREKVLKEIRNALISKKENPFSDVNFNENVYKEFEEEAVVQFALNLTKAGGTFIYCENEQAVNENLQLIAHQRKWDEYYCIDDSLSSMLSGGKFRIQNKPETFNDQKIGITRCEFLIARFGSVMVSSALSSGRRMFAYPEVHIVISKASQVVDEIKDALEGIKTKYTDSFPSQLTVITGPSRTADIEKTLVMGAHGPRELIVLMIDDQQ